MTYRFLRRILLPLFSRRIVRCEGMEHLPEHDGFLLAANHIDYLDGFYISAIVGRDRPRLVQFLSETNNYWWAGGATIPIEKNEKSASLARAFSALNRGAIICIFLEGRRNNTQTLLPGKTGLARLAAWSGKPVIPIGLSGPSAPNFLTSVFTHFFRRASVTVRIGPPLTFSKRPAETLTKPELVSMTKTIMEALGQVCGKRTP